MIRLETAEEVRQKSGDFLCSHVCSTGYVCVPVITVTRRRNIKKNPSELISVVQTTIFYFTRDGISSRAMIQI
jgi:hypothetical protein